MTDKQVAILVAGAMANTNVVTGSASSRDIQRWFGDRNGIERHEIAARQAVEFALAVKKIVETVG